MRHAKRRLQLNRFTSWRKATLRSLVISLLTYQSIRTTKSKALALTPLIGKVISLAKRNTLASKRSAFKILGDHRLVAMLFNEIGPRFANRTSGYSKIINLSKRRGDDAKLVILELTEIKKKERKPAKKEKLEKPEEALPKSETVKEKPSETQKPEGKSVSVKEKPPITKKPTKNFLGGLRNIFKKERDSL